MAKNTSKKPNFLEILGTILMLHKIDKHNKIAPKLIFFNNLKKKKDSKDF